MSTETAELVRDMERAIMRLERELAAEKRVVAMYRMMLKETASFPDIACDELEKEARG